MTRIEKPSWLLDAVIGPPKTNDDFVGCFEPQWFPYFRQVLQKDADTYKVTYMELDQNLRWQPESEIIHLLPLSDKLGFANVFPEAENHLIYNNSLKRFELIMMGKPSVLRLPLVKMSESQAARTPTTNEINPIGIPTWH
jgi:hypothetical protein